MGWHQGERIGPGLVYREMMCRALALAAELVIDDTIPQSWDEKCDEEFGPDQARPRGGAVVVEVIGGVERAGGRGARTSRSARAASRQGSPAGFGARGLPALFDLADAARAGLPSLSAARADLEVRAPRRRLAWPRTLGALMAL
jgi:hypothetical protein